MTHVDLAARLERLENSYRRTRRLAIGLGLGFGLIVALTAASDLKVIEADVVRAKRIEVPNQRGDGQAVAISAQENHYGGVLVILDSARKAMASLGVGENGGFMHINSSKGKQGCTLGVDNDSGTVVIYGQSGSAVCTMHGDEGGSGVIGVWDLKGNGRLLEPKP